MTIGYFMAMLPTLLYNLCKVYCNAEVITLLENIARLGYIILHFGKHTSFDYVYINLLSKIPIGTTSTVYYIKHKEDWDGVCNKVISHCRPSVAYCDGSFKLGQVIIFVLSNIVMISRVMGTPTARPTLTPVSNQSVCSIVQLSTVTWYAVHLRVG